jgi:hypothetical protein
MRGAPGQRTGVYQELDIRGEKGDNYVVGGWSRAWAAPSGEKRTFRLRVRFLKKNGLWSEGGTAEWNEEWVDWQYACGAVVASAAYEKMRVYIEYDDNLESEVKPTGAKPRGGPRGGCEIPARESEATRCWGRRTRRSMTNSTTW